MRGTLASAPIALWGTLLASIAAVGTSAATILANRIARRKADTEAQAAVESADVDRDRLSLDGLAAYADRLEKENERLRHDNAAQLARVQELGVENVELRDLRELIEQLRGGGSGA